MDFYRIGLARAKVMNNEKDVDLKDICESYPGNRNKDRLEAWWQDISRRYCSILMTGT